MGRNEFRSEYQRWEAQRRKREMIRQMFAWLIIGIVISGLVILAFNAWEYRL